MFGCHECEENQIDDGRPDDIAVSQGTETYIGMMEKCGTPQIEAQPHRSDHRHAFDLGCFPPVEIIAIHADEREADHESGPQNGSEPVDAEKWNEHRAAYRSDKEQDEKHHQCQQPGHDPVYIFPLREKRGIDRGYAAQLDGAIDHKIYIAEENSHIADRSEPELNGRIARECSLHPEPSGHQTGRHEDGNARCHGAYHICGDQHHSRYQQLDSVGVPELDAEHHGEIYRHADEGGIAGHQNIFLHQSRGADHVGGGCKIDPS